MNSCASMTVQKLKEFVLCQGGFALWPSKFTNYSVAASSWRNHKGNVLREFADGNKI